MNPENGSQNNQAADVTYCIHCERVFPVDKHKLELIDLGDGLEDFLEICPYDDCDGATLDSWDWERIREINPDYPQIPSLNTHYPMYGPNNTWPSQ